MTGWRCVTDMAFQRKEYQKLYAREKRKTPEGKIAAKKNWEKYWGKIGKEERNKQQRKAYFKYRLKQFGLTEEAYEALAKDGCAICGGENTWRRRHARLCLDHDHKTNKFRGLLCGSCNSALGYFKDDLAIVIAAVRYLQGR